MNWILRSTLTVVLVFLLVGCAGSPPRQTDFMEQAGIDMSKRELQLRVYGLGEYMVGAVESAADEIAAGNPDLDVVQNAMLWKINGLPVILSYTFISDPLAAAVVLWGVAIQMRLLFTEGAGLDLFGDRQEIAVDATRDMERRAREFAASLKSSAHLDSVEAKLTARGREYPVQGLGFTRPSHENLLATVLDQEIAGGLAATGAINEQMMALADQLNAQGRYIPKQARWQAELLMAQLPGVVDYERERTLEALREEIHGGGTLTDFLTTQREAVFADIRRERQEVVEVLREERLAVLEAAVAERTAILQAIQSERLATLEQVAQLSLELLDEGNKRAINALDRALLRSAGLLALPFFAILAVLMGALRLARRHLQLRETEVSKKPIR